MIDLIKFLLLIDGTLSSCYLHYWFSSRFASEKDRVR
jgi:hypothetical protein